VAGIESPALVELLGEAPCRVQSFGVEVDADWCAHDLEPGPSGWSFRLRRSGTELGTFRLAAQGRHNVRNAVAALAVAAEEGVDVQQAGQALAGFGGVKRRLELRGEARGVVVYDDFAHHPTAVRETLAALRAAEAPGRLVAVFEPRSYTSRTRVFLEGFAAALATADAVVVAPAHQPGKVPAAQRISEQELVAGVQAHGTPARFLPHVDVIVAQLAEELEPGDRVAILSNGGFGRIHERLLAALAGAGSASGSV
jgi:UDP-N-acetylmuramate: L-alanyl-gamma-D-glutamyl-meso-diaminopimelate ligase